MSNNKSNQFNEVQKELALISKALSRPARIAIIQILSEKK